MILDDIVAHKRREIVERMREIPLAELEARAERQPAQRDFAEALHGPGMPLIAEIKRASPSKGVFAPGLRANEVARCYAESGAAAISVLTDERFFLGGLADLEAARRAVGAALPILRKDFLLDPYQVVEARASGADAVLLIVRILTDDALAALLAEAARWGMLALVEVHDEHDIGRIERLDPPTVAINSRNLSDFSVDLTVFGRLRHMLPATTVVVAASGIRSAQDVANARAAGADAVLIGEALVTSDDPGAKLRELIDRGVA